MRAGDLAALDRITRCRGERLLAAGRRHCRNAEEAEDAVQEALIQAGLHLRDYRGEGAPEGWVVRMVARACSRMRRGHRNDPARHVPLLDAPGLPQLTTDAPDPEDAATRAELSARLGAALLELPAEDRAVLMLAEAEGWTGPQIAAELGLSAEAVRARLSRARRRLRARFTAAEAASIE